MKDKIFGLNKNVFFLGLTSLFNDFSSEMVFSVFPAFFVSILKAGAASLGLVDGIAESLSNFFKIYSGNLSDRIQKRKPLIVMGYTLSVLTRPFYQLVPTVVGALGLRVADRVGKGLRDAPRDAIISLSSPAKEFGRSFGYHRAMDTVGAILGPLLAYFVLKYFPLRFDLVFFIAFGIGILAIFTLLFISDVANIFIAKNYGIGSSFRHLSGKIKIFLISIFILSVGSLPIAIILLKTAAAGLMIASVPLFYMIYNLPYAGFSITAGKMSDKVGPRKIIFIGYTTLLISYAILSFAKSIPMLIVGFITLGFFPALTDGVQRAFAAQITQEEFRGSVLGLLNAANGFGVLVAGIMGGYLWQHYSSSVAFVAASAAVVIGLLFFLLAAKGNSDLNG